jgi:hypothetical protein
MNPQLDYQIVSSWGFGVSRRRIEPCQQHFGKSMNLPSGRGLLVLARKPGSVAAKVPADYIRS